MRDLLSTLRDASAALQQSHQLALQMGDTLLAARIREQGVDVLRLIGRVATRQQEVVS